MSIKSDRWIKRMAEQHAMIAPFEPGQIKHDAAGQRIVSFGTSSYGYDVRCSREFKIFTNINSTIVDPKRFDPGSFVDVESDVCIIPRTALRWHGQWSTSASRATRWWCAWARAPTRAAASSST